MNVSKRRICWQSSAADRQESKLESHVRRGDEAGSRENPVAGPGTLGFATGFRVTLREHLLCPAPGRVEPPCVCHQRGLSRFNVDAQSFAGSGLLRSRERAGLGRPGGLGSRLLMAALLGSPGLEFCQDAGRLKEKSSDEGPV